MLTTSVAAVIRSESFSKSVTHITPTKGANRHSPVAGFIIAHRFVMEKNKTEQTVVCSIFVKETCLHRAGTDGKWEVWEVLCVEVDVEDTRRIGGGLIALNEYVDVAVGIHVDVLGRRLKRLISLGSAVLRLREAAV